MLEQQQKAEAVGQTKEVSYPAQLSLRAESMQSGMFSAEPTL
jgi:hypothetical protein